MTTVNIYLSFNGNCLEAFNFYKSVLGGEFSYVGTFGEMPPQEGMPPLPESEKSKIMHISLPISSETILMGSDVLEFMGPEIIQGNNFSINISPDSKEEADRLFAGLSEGGTIVMPLEFAFWGAYYGMFTDKFGINWMINMELN
ncbi:MAG: VOC family protein [Bacteroidales bacterium]|nr:VOC family protein [Bacteroidales bacterium]